MREPETPSTNVASLLPSGVARVEVVKRRGGSHRGPGGPRCSGITNYSAGNRLIAGQKPSHRAYPGQKDYDEVIHRNNLILCD